jgi:transcriptional antiterminator RfaH
MNTWYAVLTKPRRETVAEENLQNQGFRVYLPRLAIERRRGGKWVQAVEPLFPRYLFLAIGQSPSFAPVRSTLGVASMVSFGGQPAVVPHVVIDALKSREDPDSGTCDARAPFKPGDAVEFRAGPFAGLDGIFAMESGDDRVYVLLEFLGKLNRVRVDRNWLAPA